MKSKKQQLADLTEQLLAATEAKAQLIEEFKTAAVPEYSTKSWHPVWQDQSWPLLADEFAKSVGSAQQATAQLGKSFQSFTSTVPLTWDTWSPAPAPLTWNPPPPMYTSPYLSALQVPCKVKLVWVTEDDDAVLAEVELPITSRIDLDNVPPSTYGKHYGTNGPALPERRLTIVGDISVKTYFEDVAQPLRKLMGLQ